MKYFMQVAALAVTTAFGVYMMFPADVDNAPAVDVPVATEAPELRPAPKPRKKPVRRSAQPAAPAEAKKSWLDRLPTRKVFNFNRDGR